MGKSASSKAAAKATAKAAVKKDSASKAALKKAESGGVKKKTLDKLGTMSLKDKVGAALEKAQDDEAAAVILKENLDKREHSRIWNQYAAAKKANPDIEDALAKGKKEKGMAAALWFVRQNKPKFLGMSMTMNSSEKIQMKDEWCTEKQMLDKFGSEFQAHLNSGRVLWRVDPFTRDCYQYKDQGDITRVREFNKGKTLQTIQEYEADADGEDYFKELFDQDLVMQTCHVIHLQTNQPLQKG